MGAIDGLMDRAKVPDYMQMHTEGSAFVENKGISMERRSIVQNRKSAVSAKCMGKLANGRFVVF